MGIINLYLHSVELLEDRYCIDYSGDVRDSGSIWCDYIEVNM